MTFKKLHIQHFYFLILAGCWFIAHPNTGWAQNQQLTTIEGVVTDSLFEAIPFANIAIDGTTIGTTSNIEGYYKLEIKDKSYNELTVSCIGFKSKKIEIIPNISQKKNIQLIAENFELEEVIIKSRENPAHRIIKAVVKNKEINNPEKKQYHYSNSAYTKVEIDIKNVEAPREKGIINKNFGFVFENIDTLAETDVPYLPVMIAETKSTKFHFKNGAADEEVIHATKIAGTENASLAKFMGSMYMDVNIYNNQLNFDNVNIASPIINMPLLYYKYYLTDSLIDEKGRKIYELTFQPKHKKSNSFYGKLFVVDSVFAIKKIDMRLSKSANINYLHDWHINCSFDEYARNEWLLKEYNGFLDFQFEETEKWDLPGLYGLINIVYDDYNLSANPDSSYQTIKNNRYISSKDILKDDDFWNDARPAELSVREKNIYQMVDSINKVPLFIAIHRTLEMFLNGYYDFGKFELVDYQKLYSYNEIEGHRFRAGLRTSNEISEKVRVGGFLAYGTKDERFKYGANLDYIFNPLPRFSFHLNYSHDTRVLGQTDNPFLNQTILSTLLKRNPNNKLTMVNEYKASVQKEWVVGLMNTFSFAHYTLEPTEYVPFVYHNGDSLSLMRTTVLGLSTEISPGREIIAGAFERASIGNHKPVINIDMALGIKGVFRSQYNYFRLGLNYTHNLPFASFGYLKYSFQAGKIWGTVPYPLLKLHEGNETYVFDIKSFNMMNYYEFASDLYVGFGAEHHFNGFFLNKIPMLRRLNLREVVSARGLWGTVSDANLNYMKFPDGLNSLKNKPYFETGVGLENLFKLFRVDALWRLSHLNNPNIQKFSVRLSMNFAF